MVLYRIQSSANNLVFEATDSGRSFIKMRKSRGPSTDPCGTPLTTGSWLEISPSNNIPVDFYYLEMMLPISRYCL